MIATRHGLVEAALEAAQRQRAAQEEAACQAEFQRRSLQAARHGASYAALRRACWDVLRCWWPDAEHGWLAWDWDRPYVLVDGLRLSLEGGIFQQEGQERWLTWQRPLVLLSRHYEQGGPYWPFHDLASLGEAIEAERAEHEAWMGVAS